MHRVIEYGLKQLNVIMQIIFNEYTLASVNQCDILCCIFCVAMEYVLILIIIIFVFQYRHSNRTLLMALYSKL